MSEQLSEERIEAGLGALQIKRASTAEQIAEGLREMILRGDLEQGRPLREASLAASIGVSRNTMREAIRVLAREGIVTHQMHHGAMVTRLDARDVEDIFRVRRLLELAALRVSCEAEPEQLEGLADAVERLEAAVDAREWGAIIDADQLFHARLVDLLGSRRLSRFFAAIQGEVRLCMSIVDRSGSDPAALVSEHQELLELLRRGKGDRVEALMSGHLADSQRTLATVVTEEES